MMTTGMRRSRAAANQDVDPIASATPAAVVKASPKEEPKKPTGAEYISKIAGVRARRNIEGAVLKDYIRTAWPKENMGNLSKQAFESIVTFLDRDQTTNEAVVIEIKRLRAQAQGR